MFCSEDFESVAEYCCFCKLPLPTLCKVHLEKHPMNTDFPHHIHLPLSARCIITTEEARAMWKPWLFGLHSNFLELQRNEQYMTAFKTSILAAKFEIIAEVESQYQETKAALKALKAAFRTSLRTALEEACVHALDQSYDEPSHLAELMRNDPSAPQRLKLFSSSVLCEKEKARKALQFRCEIGVPELSHLAFRSEERDIEESNRFAEESMQKMRIENDAYREEIARLKRSWSVAAEKESELSREIEKLKSERDTFASEIRVLRRNLDIANAENSSLASSNAELLKRICVKVSIRMGDLPCITFDSYITETIKEIKFHIRNLMELSVESLKLYFQGVELDNEKSLGDYSILGSVELELIAPYMQILITGLNGKALLLDVKRKDSIASIKKQITRAEGIPVASQELTHNGKRLKNQLSLRDYSICNNSTLQVKIRSHVRVLQKIYVQISLDFTLPIEVDAREIISTVKQKILLILKLPLANQKLLFLDNELDDNKSLDEYKIKEESTIVFMG